VRVGCGDAYWLAQDATHLAWSTFSGAVYERSKAGGDVRLVATVQDSVNDLSITGGYLYWTAAVYVMSATTGQVSRKPLDGGAVQVLASGLDGPGSVASDDLFAYWISGFPGEISRVSVTGGTVTPIVPSAPGAISLIIDGAFLYWGNDTSGSVMRAPITGGAATTLFAGQCSPRDLAVGNGRLYWAESCIPGGVHGGSVTGLGPVDVLASNEVSPDSVAVDLDRVYWIAFDMSGTHLRSAPRDGGTSVLELSPLNANRLAVDDTDIYVSNPNGVWRIPK
jgi:hypothetical protein